MKKRILSILVSLLLLSCIITLSVNAEGPETSNGESNSIASKSEEYQQALDDFKANVETFLSVPNMSTSDFYAEMDSIDNNVFNQLAWEVPTSVNSVTQLNLEYANLLENMSFLGVGQKYEIELPEFDTGYSVDLNTKFEEQFGDVLNQNAIEITIPDGMSIESIMKDAATERDSQFSDFMNSDAYKSILSSISIGDCFEAASQKLHMKGLKDGDALGELLDPLYDGAYGDWQDSISNYEGNYNDLIEEGFMGDVGGVTYDDYYAVYSQLVSENATTVGSIQRDAHDILWQGTYGLNNSLGMGQLISIITADEGIREGIIDSGAFPSMEDEFWWPSEGLILYDMTDVFGSAGYSNG